MRRFRRPEAEPGGHPDARFGSARGVAPVAPLPPPRPSPTRNASPAQNLGCVKVDVSQLRKSSCLLTPAEVHRHLQHPQTALGAGLSNRQFRSRLIIMAPLRSTNRSLKLSTARGAAPTGGMSSFRGLAIDTERLRRPLSVLAYSWEPSFGPDPAGFRCADRRAVLLHGQPDRPGEEANAGAALPRPSGNRRAHRPPR